jgi:hypothetical protein
MPKRLAKALMEPRGTASAMQKEQGIKVDAND